jgi:hypothetical protein
MSLKALTPLLDPVLGQNVELGLCGERMELREMLLLGLGPSSFSLTLFSYLLALRGGSLSDPKQGQGVKLALWGPFKHCSAPQNTKACKFSTKSISRGFPAHWGRCPFQASNLSIYWYFIPNVRQSISGTCFLENFTDHANKFVKMEHQD